MLELLFEVKFLINSLETIRRLTKPVLGQLFFLYMVYFFYASLGSILYGGAITRKTATEASAVPFYWLMNFNDFGYGIITLFHIMVVNNWFVTVNMYVKIFESNGPYLFFISFWIICVMIVMNVVTASVIEVFQTTEDEIEDRFKYLDNQRELKGYFEGLSKEEIKLRVLDALRIQE
jgi:hypothetical protein